MSPLLCTNLICFKCLTRAKVKSTQLLHACCCTTVQKYDEHLHSLLSYRAWNPNPQLKLESRMGLGNMTALSSQPCIWTPTKTAGFFLPPATNTIMWYVWSSYPMCMKSPLICLRTWTYIGGLQTAYFQDTKVFLSIISKIFYALAWKYLCSGQAWKTAVTQHPLLFPLLPLVRQATPR